MIDFPNSPTVGQQFTAAGVTWVWDGTKWTASGLGTAYLPLAGGTMTGPVVLAADPAANLQAATKQYVDAGVNGVRYGDNRIINGDMRIDQRNAGATISTFGYAIDRWSCTASTTGKFVANRANATAADFAATGFGNSFRFGSSSAYTAPATEQYGFWQAIEADMLTDLAYGTANAQPITVSFWTYCTLSGLFSGSLQSYGTPRRSYPFTFNIPTANTWTKIAITIPGDTGGGTVWPIGGNAGALYLFFEMGSGANARGPAGAWATASYNGATGSVNLLATNGANFYLTGVKLEVGSIATPYNRQSLAKSLADCQRYYQLYSSQIVGGYGVAGAGLYANFVYQTAMRASPTVTPSSIAYNNASNVTINNIAPNYARLSVAITAPGTGYATYNATFDAEL